MAYTNGMAAASFFSATQEELAYGGGGGADGWFDGLLVGWPLASPCLSILASFSCLAAGKWWIFIVCELMESALLLKCDTFMGEIWRVS